MATTWIYQRGSEAEPGGPVRFRELVQLVRAETLRADDLVKADWEEIWRPAATVVGLFKMAGREDVLARWEAERAAAEVAAQREAAKRSSVPIVDDAADSELSPNTLSFATADDLDLLLGGAAGGLSGTETGRQIEPALSCATPGFESGEETVPSGEVSSSVSRSEIRHQASSSGVSSSGPSRMLETIESAVAEAEIKEQQRTRTSRWARLGIPDLSGAGSGALRWGGALLFANVVAVAILSWSELQTQRFPQRGGATTQSEIFPFWGYCSSREYAFLLIDTVILAGFCGYLAARYLEIRAEGEADA